MSGVDINGSATIEPFNGFRVSLNFTKRQTLNTSSNFRYEESINGFDDLNLTQIGTFTMSYSMWATTFDQLDRENYASDAFDQFKNNRYVVAQRLNAKAFGEGGAYSDRYASSLGAIDPKSKFPEGFSSTHQDVLLYSFISAYSGKNAGTVKLTPFQKIPIPNWRVNYNGLAQMEPFKEWFSNISIKHAYSSTLNLGSFYQPIDFGSDTLEEGGNITTQYTYNSGISLIERLTPLLGVDITTKGGISFRLEYKTDRSLTMNLIQVQMVEVRNKEWTIGGGFRASNVRLPISFRGARIILKNDLNIRFDFSLRDGVTVVRQIEQGTNNATAGIKTLTIRPTIDYKISDNLNFRMFYNRNVNTPVTSNSYPTALTDFGITLRYTLQ
jgi:cell surface protein SprA